MQSKTETKSTKPLEFICARCGNDIGIGRVIRRKVYCRKCAEIIKGVRAPDGKYIGPGVKQ